MDLLRKNVEVKRTMNSLENPFVDRLQSELYGTVQISKQACGMAIYEVSLGLKVIVKVGGFFKQ